MGAEQNLLHDEKQKQKLIDEFWIEMAFLVLEMLTRGINKH